MVYSIDFMHLNNGHMYPTQFIQMFSSASCVQQLIIPERLNQIYIVTYRWEEEIRTFRTTCHLSKSVTCIKFKGSGYDRSSTCERKSAVGINITSISPISIRSTLIYMYVWVLKDYCGFIRCVYGFVLSGVVNVVLYCPLFFWLVWLFSILDLTRYREYY